MDVRELDSMAGLDDVIAVTTARLEALETEAAREVPCFDRWTIRNVLCVHL